MSKHENKTERASVSRLSHGCAECSNGVNGDVECSRHEKSRKERNSSSTGRRQRHGIRMYALPRSTFLPLVRSHYSPRRRVGMCWVRRKIKLWRKNESLRKLFFCNFFIHSVNFPIEWSCAVSSSRISGEEIKATFLRFSRLEGKKLLRFSPPFSANTRNFSSVAGAKCQFMFTNSASAENQLQALTVPLSFRKLR